MVRKLEFELKSKFIMLNHKNNPRWCALIDDNIVIAPTIELKASLLIELAKINPETTLFRDYNSDKDKAIDKNQNINLSEGNVFYTVKKGGKYNDNKPTSIAKLAFFVDDRFEIVTIDRLSYSGFCDLFGLDDVNLYRDFESPNDEIIKDDSVIFFKDGPTFYTRPKESKIIKIFVNSREKEVQKKELSYKEIVEFAFGCVGASETVYTITYSKGPHKNPEGDMVDGDIVKIKEGMVFDVTATSRS